MKHAFFLTTVLIITISCGEKVSDVKLPGQKDNEKSSSNMGSTSSFLINPEVIKQAPPPPTVLQMLFAKHPDLEELDIRDVALTQDDIREIAKVYPDLQTLFLINTGIGDSEFQQLGVMSKLTYLNLRGTKVTDAGLESLKKCKGLQWLALPAATVSTDFKQQLEAAIPGLLIDLSP